MRHNNIRDFEATLLREVCKDVKVEPVLMPVGVDGTDSSNDAEKARLDVSGAPWRGHFSTFESCIPIRHLMKI